MAAECGLAVQSDRPLVSDSVLVLNLSLFLFLIVLCDHAAGCQEAILETFGRFAYRYLAKTGLFSLFLPKPLVLLLGNQFQITTRRAFAFKKRSA